MKGSPIFTAGVDLSLSIWPGAFGGVYRLAVATGMAGCITHHQEMDL